jgi:hypothetical protein
MRFRFWNLSLRLLRFLNGSNVLTPQFLVKFMHSLDELRRHVGRRLDLGCRFRFSFGIGFWLWFNL